MKVLRVAILILFIISASAPVFADDMEIMKEIKALKVRIVDLERKLAEKDSGGGDYVSAALSDDIKLGAGATFIIQGTNNANGDNLSAQGEDVGDSSYSIDLTLEKEFDDYGLVFVHLEAGGGAGVEDELKVFSNVNRDADNDENVRLTEVWYEHYWPDARSALRVGKIDASGYIDTNEYANDECAQFLGRIFRNSLTIEFADNGAGCRLALEPNELFDINLVVMDANGDWEDVFDNTFIAGQLNIKPHFFERSGNYRVYAWRNDNEHTKWSDATQTKEEGYGFGLSCDQELTDNLGAFLRFGWQDEEQRLNGLDDDFSLEYAWSSGIQLKGSVWGRDDDVLGLAFGQAIPSEDYKNAGANLRAKSEDHLELYYNIRVNDHLALTPDLQIISDPYGNDATNGSSTIAVYGMRGQLDF